MHTPRTHGISGVRRSSSTLRGVDTARYSHIRMAEQLSECNAQLMARLVLDAVLDRSCDHVQFHRPETSQALKPEYAKAATQLKALNGDIVLAKVRSWPACAAPPRKLTKSPSRKLVSPCDSLDRIVCRHAPQTRVAEPPQSAHTPPQALQPCVLSLRTCSQVDATEEPQLAGSYGVTGYPTLKWFVDGKAQEYLGGRTECALAGHLQTFCG